VGNGKLTIFTFGLEWDCISLAKKVKESFIKRKFTKKNSKPLDDSMTFGMSNHGDTAFIVEGFDTKKSFGLVVTLPTDKKEIRIMGGKYNNDASLKAKYNKTFSDLSEASKYFEEALKEYDKLE
jgi:hypothetical protein